MRYSLPLAAWTLALTALAAPLSAQDFSGDVAPAHLTALDGAAMIDRDSETFPAETGMPIVPGDRLRTERARAEILFPDGSALDLDEFTTIELQAPDRLRLREGRMLLVVSGAANPATARSWHVDTQVAGIDTYGPGEYTLTLRGGRAGAEAELAVARGSAALTGDRGTVTLRAGELSVTAGGGLPSYPQPFNTARVDALAQWAAERRDERRGAISAQYLPPDLRMYGGTLERAGDWQYDSSYGYVWYPRVSADWRPYYDGYWSSVPRYGWTWIGVSAWTWPTHHYGRWGITGSRWFWIPDRRFAPAWVSWAAAPGYVSWCPLGFDNRPVFSLAAAFTTSRPAMSAWVVLPRERFGTARAPLSRFATTPRALPPRTPFVASTASPMPPPRSETRHIVGGVPPAAGSAVAPRASVAGDTRTWQGRAPDRSVSRSTPATPPASAQSPGVPQGPVPTSRAGEPPRTYQPVRRHVPSPGGIPSPAATPPGGVLPVYTPRPVDRSTYGVQGAYAPRSSIPREGGAPRDAPRVEAAPSGGRREYAAPRSGPRAEPPPAAASPAPGASAASRGGAAPSSGTAQPATTAGQQSAPRGHRAR